jgi:hypothetical protein
LKFAVRIHGEQSQTLICYVIEQRPVAAAVPVDAL